MAKPGPFADWRANAGQPHIQIALMLFRLAGRTRESSSPLARAASPILSVLYRLYSLSVVSMDIPTRTAVGPRLVVHHGFGLVIHADAVIGADVILRHGVTIGARSGERSAPHLGDRTEVGSAAQVIGSVVVGADARIGSGAIVVRDVDEGSTVVGNPARVIRQAAR